MKNEDLPISSLLSTSDRQLLYVIRGHALHEKSSQRQKGDGPRVSS